MKTCCLERLPAQTLDEGECGEPAAEEDNDCGHQQVPGGLGKVDEYEWDQEDVSPPAITIIEKDIYSTSESCAPSMCIITITIIILTLSRFAGLAVELFAH